MNLQRITNYLKNVDPCGEESICLVKAGCHLQQLKPWKRSYDCPDYKKYIKRNRQRSQILAEIIDWFWIIAMIITFFSMIGIFVLGIIKLIETTQRLI